MKRTLLAAALLGLAAAAGAQTSATTTPTTTPSAPSAKGDRAAMKADLARGDRKFVENATEHGIAEVAMGKLASVRAQHPDVKAFGQKMVDDHSKANDELRRLADAKGVKLPAEADRGHRRDADKLGKKNGADFDREYMEHMVKDHKKDVKEFQKAAKDLKDPELRDFASRTLPTLQQHLQMAEATHAVVKNERGDRKGSGSAGATSGGTSGTGSTPGGAATGTPRP
jgi:putative membrane protein